jgi:hypothetical protein
MRNVDGDGDRDWSFCPNNGCDPSNDLDCDHGSYNDDDLGENDSLDLSGSHHDDEGKRADDDRENIPDWHCDDHGFYFGQTRHDYTKCDGNRDPGEDHSDHFCSFDHYEESRHDG